MNRRSVGVIAVLAVSWAWVALAQTPKKGAAKPPAAGTNAASAPIATVGSRSVSRQEFEARVQQAMTDYHQRVGQDVPAEMRPALRRQLLESLIRREMLVQEAARRGIAVSDAEAEQQLQQDAFFNPGGKFDPQRFQVVKTTQVENYNHAIAQIKLELAARKLNEKLEADLVGGDPTIAASVQRDLTRANLDVLALRSSEYRGDIREPRETEILAIYRAHPERFQQTGRGRFTALLVDQPPLPPGETLDSPAGRSWKEKMRARADSALTAARGGASFTDLEKSCGSIRHGAEVVGDNFPGFWGGDAKDRAAFYATREAQLMPAPVSSSTGWMVVHVDELQSGGPAPLSRAARQIREQLRADARLHGEEQQLRQLYALKGDSLRGTGWRIRYAAFDAGTLPAPSPTPAELDRWYRAHEADFSTFDAAAGVIQVKPFADVEADVRARWIQEQRDAAVRTAADRLLAVWQRNQRDRSLERSASMMREVGPVFQGARPDTGAAAAVLGDSLARGDLDLRSGQVPWSRGAIVYQIYDRVPNALPPFEQARPALAEQLARVREAEDQAGARALFDQNPNAFSGGRQVWFTRVVVPPLVATRVSLTKAQVEQFWERHIDRYSAPEQVRVRHILVRPEGPGAAADSSARARAEGYRQRALKGEPFEDLARKYSDDVATRDKGGDLGVFGHGAMLASFERVAFSLKVGEMSEVVRTDAGYDVMLCLQHDPVVAEPLKYVYSNVGWDAATDLADSLARRRADSLAAICRTPAQLRAAGKKLGLVSEPSGHAMGDRRGTPEAAAYFERLETTPPGTLVPGTCYDRSSGWFLAWVDSVTSGRRPSWDEVRPAAIDAYRRGAGARAIRAKRAELDSLMSAGWSFDSLGTLAGGLDHVTDASAGTTLGGLGNSGALDSLVFGTSSGGPVLKEGQLAPWLELATGTGRVRLAKRKTAAPERLAAQLENQRKVEFERKLYAYFEDLKKRYPVKILDPVLRDTPLPPPPPRNG